MDTTDSPAKVASNDPLGPNALVYARAHVSLLGKQEHMDTLNRALDALDGLPGAALIGGWTFKGFTAWAQRLEGDLADCEQYLKEGETPAQRIERERRDTEAVLNLLIREKQKNEALAKDVARYHWLREHTVATGLSRWMGSAQFLDEAVDLSMGPNVELTGADRRPGSAPG